MKETNDLNPNHIKNELVRYGKLKIAGWFLLTNAAVVISLILISGGALTNYIPVYLVMGGVFPFLGLLFSKSITKKRFKVQVIGKQLDSYFEIQEMVNKLAVKAGIEKMPEVGIYVDPIPNAFATGYRKNRALVAFSSGLIELLNKDELEAVAAHEISHVANGDMITMTIIQSVINSVVMVITLPLSAIKIIALFSEEVGVLGYWLISIIRAIIASILMFLGNLVVKSFSRRREFKADALACKLCNKEQMISALYHLDQVDYSNISKESNSYATLMIINRKSLIDIFSTHPSTERRIEKLQNI